MSKDVTISVSDRFGKTCASSGSAWEPVFGYSRAVRSGNTIAVSGTVGINPDKTYPPTAAEQTRRSLAVIQAAVEALGGRLDQVIRTRIYVVDVADCDAIGRVHGEFFGEIRPATSMVVVAKLIDEAARVEVEADALL